MDFATPMRDWSGVSATMQEITGLADGTLYYWRVRATNAAGDGPWSEPWHFTTASAPAAGVTGGDGTTMATLDGVHPDPFAGGALVGFTLARREHVTLAVIDVMGRTMVTLLDDVGEAGRHEVALDATGLPAGIYFCRMITPEGTRTTMMHLLK